MRLQSGFEAGQASVGTFGKRETIGDCGDLLVVLPGQLEKRKLSLQRPMLAFLVDDLAGLPPARLRSGA